MSRMLLCLIVLGASSASQVIIPARGQVPADPTVLREVFVVPRSVARYGRSPLHADALEAALLTDSFKPPKEGDEFIGLDGQPQKWEVARAGMDGAFTHPSMLGGYAYATFNSDKDQILILHAIGHQMAYVNREPRAGDVYNTGYVRLPIRLRKGSNEVIFHCGRGRLQVRLQVPRAPGQIESADATLPDLVRGEQVDGWGAVVVLNSTENQLENLALSAILPNGEPVETVLPSLQPCSSRKVAFRIRGLAPAEGDSCPLQLQLRQGKGSTGAVLEEAVIGLRLRQPNQTQKRTFISTIDGSVQYFALNPMRAPSADDPKQRPALYLTLHGAGVEAIGQADAYGAKPYGHIVAATNRRPFGFDWEDWGRMDAIEVLKLAQDQLGADPQKTYLTGHSMGGHGVWNLAANFPDRFAAIAPSAGWISFWSYGGSGRRPDAATPLQEILSRASNPSDTLALSRNYLQHGIYVLHGEKDDNVPVGQSRTMRQHLATYHSDFAYREQPNAGHWWGNACVDWPAIFEFFAHRKLPEMGGPAAIQFVTANPGISATCNWATIEAQLQGLKFSSIQLSQNRDQRTIVGSTENVARLSLDLRHLSSQKPVKIELDGQPLANVLIPADGGRVVLEREGMNWKVSSPKSLAHKGPHRNGPFKEAFRNRMIFVYGTNGTPEETAWAQAKARFDAEVFWYRGNGSVDVVPDTAFAFDQDRDRNVIIYGNADTNRAWSRLLGESPVQVQRKKMQVGSRVLEGDNLACLCVRPRPGSDSAMVAVISGTGLQGMRLTDRLSYFISGAGYPDCLVIGPEMLRDPTKGVRGAGIFGNDWSVQAGEFAWSE